MTTVTRTVSFTKASHRKQANGCSSAPLDEPVGRVPRVSKLMALAIRFDQLLADGTVASQSELARLAHVTQPRMTQIMNLLNLAPDIQEELLLLPVVERGSDPVTERDVRPIVAERDWGMQRLLWYEIRRS